VQCRWSLTLNIMPSSDLKSSEPHCELNSKSQWNDLTVQQLVRYEALFKLLDDIQMLDDIAIISERIATQWKYFAKVTSWRMLVVNGNGFKVIDGYRGQAQIEDVSALSIWDEYHWQQALPRLVRLNTLLDEPFPPQHLTGNSVVEIQVLPFLCTGHCVGLLSAATRNEPFSELDLRFIRLFGRFFADRIINVLLRQQTMETLLSKANHDSLTSLLNRGAIIEQFNLKIALSKRLRQPLSVILCDIDFFKVINDQYGHQTGDIVLIEVSRRLLKQIRDCDCIGRYGGEEFLLVLFPCNEVEVNNVAERMRRAIADSVFTTYSGDQISVTISLGSCSSHLHNDINLEQLLKCADDALYKSKENGRNQVTFGTIVNKPNSD
jgi:diguanylate cyclase (GGDEF)-like protein